MAFDYAAATLDEKIVLYATRSLKASYAGHKDYRFREAYIETDISAERWAAAKERCRVFGWLDSRNAITQSGRRLLDYYKINNWPKEK